MAQLSGLSDLRRWSWWWSQSATHVSRAGTWQAAPSASHCCAASIMHCSKQVRVADSTSSHRTRARSARLGSAPRPLSGAIVKHARSRCEICVDCSLTLLCSAHKHTSHCRSSSLQCTESARIHWLLSVVFYWSRLLIFTPAALSLSRSLGRRWSCSARPATTHDQRDEMTLSCSSRRHRRPWLWQRHGSRPRRKSTQRRIQSGQSSHFFDLLKNTFDFERHE